MAQKARARIPKLWPTGNMWPTEDIIQPCLAAVNSSRPTAENLLVEKPLIAFPNKMCGFTGKLQKEFQSRFKELHLHEQDIQLFCRYNLPNELWLNQRGIQVKQSS